jgi:glycosyltransferase involved in cell wall biosynthesis
VPRDAIFSALQQARAAVFPSYAEAFGIAPFEAMVRGCPTIYTAREPGPELVRDGIDGLLVDPDDPGAIAGALVRLLRDDALAADLGVQGRRRVLERYSSSVLLPQNEAFFARAVADFRR